jgi:Tfp pilus assembly protein PilV
MRTPSTHRRQRGTSLLEALVAFLVLSLGMLTVARVQTQLRLHADVARQRSEAVRLAQEDLETLRDFAAIAVGAGTRSYDAIASASRTVDTDAGNTRYVVARQIDPADAPHAKSAIVTVSWSDRSGGAQQVVLNSLIGGVDPAITGALGLARGATPLNGPLGRSIRIPLAAKNLGNGSSVLKPVGAGADALVFDNTSGVVTGHCTGINPATATRDLSAADLGSCDSAVGQLLSGVVRFSSATPPDAAHASDAPPALSIALAVTGGTAPWCASEAMKTVTVNTAAGLRIDAVPLTATPASLGVASWTDTGERFVAYHCVAYPASGAAWSGRATVVASGWTVGTGPTDRRVCRYSSDLDGNGTIAAAIEHPADYAGVSSALAHQNFLVVNGTEACPAGSAVQVAGRSGDVFVDRGTVPHQP